MEILDAGGEPARTQEPPPPWTDDLDVRLGDPSAPDDIRVEQPGAGPSAARAARAALATLATVVDAGSLAVAAVLVELITLAGGYQILALMSIGVRAEQSQQDLLSHYTVGIGICAATSLALALGALVRLRPDAPAWVRAAAGSAVLVGVLMAAVTGFLAWQLTGAAPDTGSTVFSTSG